MEARLDFRIQPQPDDVTCGPTCLHALYRYYNHPMPLQQVVSEVHMLKDGGTLAMLLGVHALDQGFDARIYTFNMDVFDPTWFEPGARSLREGLVARSRVRRGSRLTSALQGYLQFVDRGGEVLMEDLTSRLIRSYLRRGMPILAGLSSTYLYRCAREYALGSTMQYDDIAGDPQGHFVVLCGYDPDSRTVLVADPHQPNPLSVNQQYVVPVERLMCAILLGIVTYDANMLVIKPRSEPGSDANGAAQGSANGSRPRQEPGSSWRSPWPF